MAVGNIKALSYELSVRFLRQRVFSTIARYVAEYASKLTPEELCDFAAGETDVVSALETVLSEKFSEAEVSGLIQKAAPYLDCFSENDFDTIFERTVKNLDEERAAVLVRHRDWFYRQMDAAWKKLLERAGEQIG
jgi:hypothetical protein